MNRNLGLQQNIRWIFIIADIHQPIIGSDLLKKFDLLTDMKNHQLIDKITSKTAKGSIITNNKDISFKSISDRSAYLEIVNEFPDILNM